MDNLPFDDSLLKEFWSKDEVFLARKKIKPDKDILGLIQPPITSDEIVEQILTDKTNQSKQKMKDEKISIETKVMKEMADALGSAVVGGVKEILKKYHQPLVLQLPDTKKLKPIEGKTHKQFPDVLKAIGAGLNVFLVGEAGSGKTHLVEQCAKTLSLPFYCISVCAQTSASVLLGYMNANGKYVRTLFREAYENGGVFLLDEIDNGNPNVLSVLNSAMANGVCAFPDKMVQKHKDFIVCASGNTYGTGADRKYVGRLEIDAATLDRFAFIELQYDEMLERETCGNEKVAELIQYLRANAKKLQLRHIISPRASISVSRLVAADSTVEMALKSCVFKSMDDATITKVKGDASKYKNLVAAIYDDKIKQAEKKQENELKIETE